MKFCNAKGTVLYSFEAVARYRSQTNARELALSRGLAVGFCPFDGMYYVGKADHLKEACINVETPS